MRTIYLKWITIGLVFTVSLLLILAVRVNMNSKVLMEKSIHLNPNAVSETNNQRSEAHHISNDEITERSNLQTKSSVIKEYVKSKLIKIAVLLKEAKIHVRGTKTGDSLTMATQELEGVFQDLGMNYSEASKRSINKSKTICPEVYNGTTFGYPFFYKGFEVTNCSYGKPLDTLISIVIVDTNSSGQNLLELLKKISKYNQKLSVKVGTESDIDKLKRYVSSNVELKSFPRSSSVGRVWNTLIKSVTTKYVLIAPSITTINVDARLDRLIREIESLNLSAAAGAFRDKDGFWKEGCYQRAFKNYTMVFVEGYDESIHECIICDHMDGPFVMKTDTASNVNFDESLPLVGLFEDFFFRLDGEKAVCPDSMFYVEAHRQTYSFENWHPFFQKHEIYKLKFGSSEVVTDCKSYGCFSGTGYAVTPCCLKELSDMVLFTMKSCEDNNVICELQEGTLLGAVKMHKVLPWERDADLTFLTSHYTAFKDFSHLLRERGYVFVDGEALWCCVDNRTAGGKFKVNSGHWHIELYGQHIMDSELLLAGNEKPTKLLMNGQWVMVPRNPGWHARNRYGHEIYAHAQHWLATGKSSGWINYKTNQFTKCLRPGNHNCLDRINADGNLHFTDPLP